MSDHLNTRRGLLPAALSVLLLAACFPSARAADGEVSRRVLAIYNARTTENADPAKTDIHNLLEKPMNHYGLMLDYYDVNLPLPDPRGYRGIVIWLSSYEMERPEALMPWLLGALRSGVRIVMPGGLDVPRSLDGVPLNEELVDNFLHVFGLDPVNEASLGAEQDQVRLVAAKPECFGFETKLTNQTALYPFLAPSARGGMEVWQYLERKDNPAVRAVASACGGTGFWAISDGALFYSMELQGEDYRIAWNVDPFRLVRDALGLEGVPAPDVTTYWGTRGAYAHSDVDGPSNMTQDYPGPSRYCFEMIYERVLKRYPVPVTLGFIACEYDPALDVRYIEEGENIATALAYPRREWQGTQAEVATRLREIVDKAMKLPNTQSGCHGYSHPLFWRDKGPGYAIRGYDFNYEMETRGAIEYLNKNVLPKDKPVELFQWTGDCDPPEEPLAVLAAMGMPNINGGDPMYDGKYNSVYFICPLGAPKGKYLQVYTSGSNENIYTVGWTGFPGAFNNVIATFERSDSPRRLLPVNIYYHAFPAELQAGLKAIQNAYEWAMDRDLCWMRAVEYVHAVEGFAKARMGVTADGGWWVENYGACPSLRFDGESRRVDMAKSRNIAGYNYHNDSLYVSLIPGDRAEVRLTEAPASLPCLAGGSGMIRNVKAGEKRWSAEARIWADGFVELWAPEGEWRGSYGVEGGERKAAAPKRLADGKLRLELPGADGKWVEVIFER